MARNTWKSSSTTLAIKLRWTEVPLINGAGYSRARMRRPRIIERICITGTLTIMSMKNASWFAGLGDRSEEEGERIRQRNGWGEEGDATVHLRGYA
jgi:hypothetical protein